MTTTITLTASASASLEPVEKTIETPKSLIVRDGKYELKQLIVPGFDSLPPERKLFAYYLSQALESGRDIAWKQLSPNGLGIRQLLESIWPRMSEIEPRLRKPIEVYYFELLHNHGPHDPNTNEKIVMTGIDPDEFADVVAALGGSVAEARRLSPDIFDSEVGRYRVAPEGTDKIATSGTSFYGPGMTDALLKQLPAEQQRHFLSTPVLESDGRVQLQYHRRDGRFGDELARVAYYLRQAKVYANEVEKALIGAHLRTIETGDPADQERAERLWVQYKPEDFTFVLGFIETYDDPLEARGTWEGFILLKNTEPESARRNEVIRQHAAAFEKRMPVDEEFKKTGEVNPPDSEGAYLVRFGGGSNERSFRGVNLPNSSAIREELGSRSFTAFNKVNDLGAADEEFKPEALREYYQPRYHAALREFGKSLPFTLQVEFHEMLGHGSGRDRRGVDSSAALGSDYSAMEESRAEIAAMYTFTDPDFLRELKVFPAGWSADRARGFSEMAILEFFTDHIESYAELDGRTDIRQAHQLGRQMILNRTLADGAIQIVESAEGVPQVILGSIADLRASFGRYWGDVQRLKSTGDAPGLRAFIQLWGVMTPEQQTWSTAIIAAKERLNEARYTIYLNPRFELVKSTDGRPIDVRIAYESAGGPITKVFHREYERTCEDTLRMSEPFLNHAAAKLAD